MSGMFFDDRKKVIKSCCISLRRVLVRRSDKQISARKSLQTTSEQDLRNLSTQHKSGSKRVVEALFGWHAASLLVEFFPSGIHLCLIDSPSGILTLCADKCMQILQPRTHVEDAVASTQTYKDRR